MGRLEVLGRHKYLHMQVSAIKIQPAFPREYLTHP